MKAASIISTAALALVLQGGFTAAYANSTSGHCTGMTVTDYVSSDTIAETASEAWLNIADAHLTFTTSGTGCVMITFSGYAFISANSSEELHVRALLDGNNLCVPALTYDAFLLTYNATNASANSITRICKNVVAGTHTLQIQMHSQNGGNVEVDGHVLTVTHN